MRMDDDSYIHSKIEYNIFDHMRTHGRRYGFRQPVRDSAVGKGYDAVGVCDLRPLIAIVVFCFYLAWSNSFLCSQGILGTASKCHYTRKD